MSDEIAEGVAGADFDQHPLADLSEPLALSSSAPSALDDDTATVADATDAGSGDVQTEGDSTHGGDAAPSADPFTWTPRPDAAIFRGLDDDDEDDTLRPVADLISRFPEGDKRRHLQVLGTDDASKERAREMQKKSRGAYREARAARKAAAEKAAAFTAQQAAEAVQQSEGSLLSKGSIPVQADKLVRMYLMLALNGGPEFMPKTLKECMDSAKAVASIASQYRTQRKIDQVIDATSKDGDGPSSETLEALNEFKKKMDARRRAIETGADG